MASRRTPIAGRFTAQEVALAARNRGMPLEALRHELTPAGLHYLLIHFDIPPADERPLRLKGLFANPLSISMEEIKRLPRSEKSSAPRLREPKYPPSSSG